MFNLPVKYWHYGRNKSGNGNILIQDPDEVFTPSNIQCESQLSFTIKNIFQLIPQLTLDHFIILHNKAIVTRIDYEMSLPGSSNTWRPSTVDAWATFNSEIYNARNGDVVKFIKKDNDLKVHLLQNKCIVSGPRILQLIMFIVYLVDNSFIDVLKDKNFTLYNSNSNYYIENMYTIRTGRHFDHNHNKYIRTLVFQNTVSGNIVKSTGGNLILDETIDANWVIEII